MKTLVVRAGMLPVWAALPALLLAFCLQWQARLAAGAFTEPLLDRLGASVFGPVQFRVLAPPAREEAQVPERARKGDSEIPRHAAAPTAAPVNATFAARFVAAFGLAEDDEDANVRAGRIALVPATGELGAAPGSAADPDGVLWLEPDGREVEVTDDDSQYEGRTAVYVIATHTVYLPSGERLEAHSGLGGNLDNPRHVNVKNRGSTPPNVYKLVMRESRFHGVRAIRLIPRDENKMFGRDGMLAHSYMLRGGRAQSNGCVVFRDYPAFLQAFLKGDVKRLVVIDRLDAAASAKPEALATLALAQATR